MDGTLERTLTREIEAIVIPYGSRTAIPAGTNVRLLQELGGSVTVTTEYGGLYRVDSDAFDALGLEPPKTPGSGELAGQSLEQRVWEVLRTCYDPEIPVNIVELGLIYDCRLDPEGDTGQQVAHVKMTLTAPGCGMGDVLAQDIRHKLEKMPEILRAEVEVVFDPPWNQSMMSEAARLQLGFY